MSVSLQEQMEVLVPRVEAIPRPVGGTADPAAPGPGAFQTLNMDTHKIVYHGNWPNYVELADVWFDIKGQHPNVKVENHLTKFFLLINRKKVQRQSLSFRI